MLVELSVADAYGAGFEFAKPERLAQLKNDLSTYYPHNLPGHLPPGSYTDDTQMSIGLAEHLLEHEDFTPSALMNRWVNTYKRDPRNGYSRKFQKLLDEVKTGDELLKLLINKSNKCGAAMRSCPLGIIANEISVVEYAKKQAAVTHNTKEAIASSVVIALSTHYFLYKKGLKKDLFSFLFSFDDTKLIFKNEKDLWPSKQHCTSDAIPCVKAAISAVFRNDNLTNILKECIDYTGDVDSIAAMALGIASCSNEVENTLPLHLFAQLENGKYGYDYIVDLDMNLLQEVEHNKSLQLAKQH